MTRRGSVVARGLISLIATAALLVGVPNAHLEGNQPQGVEYAVEWVPIAQPDVAYDYTPGAEAPTSNNTAVI